MKMSTKGRYGLRLMVDLAAHHGNGPLLVETIAERQGISSKYIHVLLAGLKTAGLVRATRGPHGGVQLARPPSAITALEVVEAMEGRSAPTDCVLDQHSCNRATNCVIREVWCQVADAVNGVLGGLTLADLARRQGAQQEPVSTYSI